MKIISLFNNKGGVGKTTLAYHVACALAGAGEKVLMLDLDPQCNLTVCSMDEERLHEIWEEEDQFIDDYDEARKKDERKYAEINLKPRTIHYLLKPVEQGAGEETILPPPITIRENLDLIPGRITLHMYEYKISERWAGAYLGDPLAIKTITQLRGIAQRYADKFEYDYVIVDTSPSLGALNKVIISTVDGFIIPCSPDMFSLYGIRNIGNCLAKWKKEFDTLFSLISDAKREYFPPKFVQFLGYTIYNAHRYQSPQRYNLAMAHYNYVEQIPNTIQQYISFETRIHLTEDMIRNPIGGEATMHTHNTMPGMAQKYKLPIWDVPSCGKLDKDDGNTIRGNKTVYEATQNSYLDFITDLQARVARLSDE